MADVNNEFEFYESLPSSSGSVTSEDQPPKFALVKGSDFPKYKFPCEKGRSGEYLNVRQELYDSERTYLLYLQTLIEVFVDPLCANNRLFSRLDCRLLFADLRSIFAVNKEILRALRESADIFSAFSRISPFLKLYSSYASNYAKAQESIIRLWQNSRFRSFMEKHESSNRAGGNKFSALLIMPVQRVPRYAMLLKRLLENTKDGDELVILRGILSDIEDITDCIDFCLGDYENSNKLLEIQEKITVPGGILVPGRRFIHEGSLCQRQNVGEAIYRERYFWLFSDILLVGKAKPSVFPPAKKYEMKFRFPLRHLRLEYDQWDGSLQIKCKNEHLVVTSESYDTVSRWHDMLTVAVDRATKLRATLRKESSRLPVKGKKTNLRHALTKKLAPFTNGTYNYGVSGRRGTNTIESPVKMKETMEEDEDQEDGSPEKTIVGTPLIRRDELPSTPVSSRKRRARTLFDDELQSAVRKRYVPTDSFCTPSRAPLTPRTPLNLHSPSTPTTTKSMPPPRAPPPSIEFSPVRARVKRTLTQPQIRKLSNLQHISSDDEEEEENHSDKEEKGLEEKRKSDRTGGGVPWWIAESQPAEYVRATNASRVSRIVQRCSLM